MPIVKSKKTISRIIQRLEVLWSVVVCRLSPRFLSLVNEHWSQKTALGRNSQVPVQAGKRYLYGVVSDNYLPVCTLLKDLYMISHVHRSTANKLHALQRSDRRLSCTNTDTDTAAKTQAIISNHNAIIHSTGLYSKNTPD